MSEQREASGQSRTQTYPNLKRGAGEQSLPCLRGLSSIKTIGNLCRFWRHGSRLPRLRRGRGRRGLWRQDGAGAGHSTNAALVVHPFAANRKANTVLLVLVEQANDAVMELTFFFRAFSRVC